MCGSFSVRYFEIIFTWNTRPRFRKGRTTSTAVTFAASNHTEAYRLAQDYGIARFHRHKWHVSSCIELPAPHPHLGPSTQFLVG